MRQEKRYDQIERLKNQVSIQAVEAVREKRAAHKG
jgi:hypothetical protein